MCGEHKYDGALELELADVSMAQHRHLDATGAPRRDIRCDGRATRRAVRQSLQLSVAHVLSARIGAAGARDDAVDAAGRYRPVLGRYSQPCGGAGSALLPTSGSVARRPGCST